MKTLGGTALLMIFVSTISLCDCQTLFCSHFASPKYLQATSAEKWITFPGDRDVTYRPNQNCEWIIRTGEKDHVITFTVTDRLLEGQDVRGDCVSDYVDIFDVVDGHPVFKDRFCGTGPSISFQSSQPVIMVQFISNMHHQYGGFKASYKAYKEPEESPILATVLGVSAALFLLVLVICALVLFCRKRKRKPSASARYGAGELQSDVTPSLHAARPSTPPPPYNAIDRQDNGLDLPPPSYASVIRESSNLEYNLSSNSDV